MKTQESLTNVLVIITLSVGITAQSLAQSDASVDKSKYNLFHPTPRELWRDVSPDRPDFTESPVTVDAGAVQLEMSLFDYAKNGDIRTYVIAPVNLKVGVLNNADIQFVFDPYVDIDANGPGSANGVGDTQIRFKVNLWGNDEGDDAFGVMPYIKLPTASDELSNDHVEGGVIFPYSVDLSEGVSLGLMLETDFVYDSVDDNYDLELLHTVVVGMGVTEELGIYAEGVGIASSESDSDYQALLAGGVTFAMSDDLILDFGVVVGLAGDADDVNVFSGFTLRF